LSASDILEDLLEYTLTFKSLGSVQFLSFFVKEFSYTQRLQLFDQKHSKK